MLYKEYSCTTHQSNLVFKKDTVEKNYLKNHNKNKLSSVKNEMYCLNKFSINNDYSPEIIHSYDVTYQQLTSSIPKVSRVSLVGSPDSISQPRIV